MKIRRLNLAILTALTGLVLGMVRADVYQTIILEASAYSPSNGSGDQIVDNNGNNLTSSFLVALGTFANSFTPTAENTGDWAGNWEVFSSMAIADGLPTFQPRFKLEEDMLTNPQEGETFVAGSSAQNPDYDFSNADAWVWIYNSQDIFDEGAEWFLGRVSLVPDEEDPTFGMDVPWVFPDATGTGECCPGEAPLNWAVIQFTTENPVWGNQSGYEGAGFFNNSSPDFELQTYIVVPEPGSLVISAIALGLFGATVLVRRSIRS